MIMDTERIVVIIMLSCQALVVIANLIIVILAIWKNR